ncbi:MAG TPA: DUF4012 domain-containing protein [Ktedonobacterales bacterium]
MDEDQQQPPRQRGRSQDGSGSGGLLSRYAGGQKGQHGPPSNPPRPPRPATPGGGSTRPPDQRSGAPGRGLNGGGLLGRFAPGQTPPSRDANGSLTRDGRDGDRQSSDRQPSANDWRASDYDPAEFDAMLDQAGDESRRYQASSRGRRDPSRRDHRDDGRRNAGRRDRDGWDDEAEWQRDWDAGWETGSWDQRWADEPEAADGGWGDGWDDEDAWSPVDARQSEQQSHSLIGADAASATGLAAMPMGRIARWRMLRRTNPGTATLLLVFFVGFLLTCVAPIIPLARLGFDVADIAHRASHLQALVADPTSVLSPSGLSTVQADVDSIEHDLYEINAFTNIIGAPLAAVSSTFRNYRLLVRMGFDLTAAADEGIQVGQTLLTPLQGGALSSDPNNPGLTPDDIGQARSTLADAKSRVQDAVAAYDQLNQAKLPSQLRPGSKYGSLLALLPQSVGLFNELDTLLQIAPGLLGVGQPAYYLVIAMDRTELRAGGGFQGNYGILTLAGGKQPATQPLSLQDAYALDTKYYDAHITGDPTTAQYNCGLKSGQPTVTPDYYGPQPPEAYWWWPYRNFSWCIDWGVRDSNLSPDFPTNARAAIAIAQQTPGVMPGPGPIQGVVGFTSAFIGDLLQLPEIGSLTLPQYPKDAPVTAQNLELEIHCHQEQLGPCPAIDKNINPADRKAFTHDLASALLAKIKTLHGGGLKPVVQAALTALKNKDLQVYFTDPRAELILQQLGLSSGIYTGGGDGFFVVDTNDGGNKANLYVTQREQDLVTLLPNGGAIHRLEVTYTYAYPSHGWVYADPATPEDYNDVSRVYMPGSATLLGYQGYAIPPNTSSPYVPRPLNDGGDGYDHFLGAPVTNSDVSGRTMVMGFVDVSCHNDILPYDGGFGQPMWGVTYQDANTGNGQACNLNPSTHTQTIDVEWYTPHAWTPGANGKGGSYSELIEKQAGTDGPPSTANPSGSVVTVQVYVDTGQLHGAQSGVDWTDLNMRAAGLQHATKIFDGPLSANMVTPAYTWSS